MSERINTPFTNEHFVAFCEKMVGQPYWYGSVVYKCTENLRARKAKQYPAHYGSGRTARYRDDIAKKKVCADCVGLIKGYQWTNGGQGVIESIGTRLGTRVVVAVAFQQVDSSPDAKTCAKCDYECL